MIFCKSVLCHADIFCTSNVHSRIQLVTEKGCLMEEPMVWYDAQMKQWLNIRARMRMNLINKKTVRKPYSWILGWKCL